jgi:hypothetical protein
MPKTPRLKAALAPRVNDEPLVPDIMQDLLPEEKGELRAFFEGRVWKKVLANVRLSRPSLFPLGLDGALGPQIAINRLHQLQGWKLLEVALAQPILAPLPKRAQLVESYPDAGRPDFQRATDMKPITP